ncbi:MAG: ribonuclease domain-containing protein [Caldilineaceae bacterium]
MTKKSSNRPSSSKQQYSLGGIVVTLLLGLIYWWLTGTLPNAETPQNANPTVLATANVAADASQGLATATPTTEATVVVAAVPTEPAVEEAATSVATDETAVDQEEAPEQPSTATASATASPTTVPSTATPQPSATATTPPKPTAAPTNPPRAGPPGMPVINYDELPREALETIILIGEGGPFPYDRDGITFQNREGLLPNKPRGYYSEYTVVTPGSRDRGARRIIAGEDGEIYYTDDHYESFFWVLLP